MTPVASWLFLVAVFTLTILAIWIATGGTRRRHRRHWIHDQRLEELARHERARAAIARAQAQSNVRIPKPPGRGTE